MAGFTKKKKVALRKAWCQARVGKMYRNSGSARTAVQVKKILKWLRSKQEKIELPLNLREDK